jgi:hypothetical protein
VQVPTVALIARALAPTLEVFIQGALLGEVVEVTGNAVRVRRCQRRPSGGAALFNQGAARGEVKSMLPAISGASAADARGVPVEVPEPIPGCGKGFDTGHPEVEEPGGPLFGVEPTTDGWWLRFGTPGPDLSHVEPGHAVYPPPRGRGPGWSSRCSPPSRAPSAARPLG